MTRRRSGLILPKVAPGDTDALAYAAALAADGTTLTPTAMEALNTACQTLKGNLGGPSLWPNLRTFLTLDPAHNRGTGFTLRPIISGHSSTGLPVNAADPAQTLGSGVSGAPWGSPLSGNQYWQMSTPVANMDWQQYTVVYLAYVGNNGGVATMLSMMAGVENLQSLANTGGWRMFANGRVDGFGGNVRLADKGLGERQTRARISFKRESLSTIERSWNGKRYRATNLNSTATSAPTDFWLGYHTGLPSVSTPISLMLFDRALTPTEIASAHDCLERLHESAKAGSGRLKWQANGDAALLETATPTEFLLHS